MRKINFNWLTLLILSLAFSSGCDAEKEAQKTIKKSPRVRKSVVLKSPKMNSSYPSGSEVELVIGHKDSEKKIDSAFLLFNGKKMPLVENRITIRDTESVGRYSLEIKAYHNGTLESIYPNVTFLPQTAPIDYAYRIVNTYPHDINAWTQGLFIADNLLYESTGQKGESSIRKSNLETGEISSIQYLDNQYFGEGSTMIGDQIFMLTWTAGKAFVFDKGFNEKTTFNYSTEGWGLTAMDGLLVMSDGTEKLYFRDPNDFSIRKTLQVYDHNGKVEELNELEYIDGKLYANVWGEDKIVIINPENGIVEGLIDFTGIFDGYRDNRYDKSMNGIAVSDDGRIFVTGKYWPDLYEIIITPKSNPT